jgi:hypothetical protein
MGPLPRVLPSATAASLPGMRVPAAGSMSEEEAGSGMHVSGGHATQRGAGRYG